MFSNTEDLLPVISFNTKSSADEQKKHQNFVNRMTERATPRSRCDSFANGICASENRRDRGVGRAARGARPTLLPSPGGSNGPHHRPTL